MAAAAYRPAAAYQRRKVFHIIPTGKEKKFSTLGKLFEKFLTVLKTVLKEGKEKKFSTFGKPSEKFLTVLKTVLKELFHMKHFQTSSHNSACSSGRGFRLNESNIL